MAKVQFVIFICLFFFFSCENHKKTGEDKQKVEIIKGDENKPIVNVFIENSASMDGYVKGTTEFEQAIYNYLSDIKISGATDSLSLYYINSRLIPQGAVTEDMSVLSDFIEKLEPNTFKTKGGNRGTSDIAEVLKSVLQETNNQSVSILITDGIFSPGSGCNAENYLVNQQIGIKNTFSDFIKNKVDCGVIVYQLSSKFNGIYYNKFDQRIQLETQRPFYIYLIGSNKHLKKIIELVPENKFKGSGVINIFSITKGNNRIKYFINPSIGKFKKSKTNTRTTIEDLEKDSHTGKVKFAVNVDFSNLLLDDYYLMDSSNYENCSRYNLEIKPARATNQGYTHTLNFSSNKVVKGDVIVKLKAKRPLWVDEVNDNIGLTAVDSNTFGIKYQIDGIYDAFTFNNMYYSEIKISIK
jgi:hypothetical protein